MTSADWQKRSFLLSSPQNHQFRHHLGLEWLWSNLRIQQRSSGSRLGKKKKIWDWGIISLYSCQPPPRWEAECQEDLLGQWFLPLGKSESLWMSPWILPLWEILLERPMAFSPRPEYWGVMQHDWGWVREGLRQQLHPTPLRMSPSGSKTCAARISIERLWKCFRIPSRADWRYFFPKSVSKDQRRWKHTEIWESNEMLQGAWKIKETWNH